MAKPFALFTQPSPSVERLLVFPSPDGFSEREMFAARDDLESTALIRFSDGGLALADMPTFAGASSRPAEFGTGAWRNLRACRRLKDLFDLIDTWHFHQQCQRRTTQMWLYDRAGFGTAAPSRARWAEKVKPFEELLRDRLLAEARSIVLGGRPGVNEVIESNLDWPLASVQRLESASTEVELRRRAQALDLSFTLGFELPLAEDGIRFDDRATLFTELEFPNDHVAELAERLQCSTQAVRHVLRNRSLFSAARQPLAEDQRRLIRSIDAVPVLSHLPRSPDAIKGHGDALTRAALLQSLTGHGVEAWLRYAYQQNARPCDAASRLYTLLTICRQFRSAVAQAQDPGAADRSLRLFAGLHLLGGPCQQRKLTDDVYQQAYQSMSASVLHAAAEEVGVSGWPLVSKLLEPLSGLPRQHATAKFRWRVLRSVSEIQLWGQRVGNCLAHPWAALHYIARQRLVVAAEMPTPPHVPVGTLSVTGASDLHPMQAWEGYCITECQLAGRLASRHDDQRQPSVDDLKEDFETLVNSGHALLLDDRTQREWQRGLAPWLKVVANQMERRPIGKFLDGAVRQIHLLQHGALPEEGLKGRGGDV